MVESIRHCLTSLASSPVNEKSRKSVCSLTKCTWPPIVRSYSTNQKIWEIWRLHHYSNRTILLRQKVGCPEEISPIHKEISCCFWVQRLNHQNSLGVHYRKVWQSLIPHQFIHSYTFRHNQQLSPTLNILPLCPIASSSEPVQCTGEPKAKSSLLHNTFT